MSYADWSNNKKKKKNNSNSNSNTKASSYSEWSNAKHGITEDEDDIAPVRTKSELLSKKEELEESKGTFKDFALNLLAGPFGTEKMQEKADSYTSGNKAVDREISKIDEELAKLEGKPKTNTNPSFKDLTVNSFMRGVYNSKYGKESFNQMMGQKNNKEYYADKLNEDKYSFEADDWYEMLLSGPAEQMGQWFTQYTDPKAVGGAAALAGTTALAGQLGPQVALPEEIVTVPSAALVGFKTGATTAAFEIEAGHAYNEMLEQGISPETASVLAMGAGGVIAGLDRMQLDDLVKSYKILGKFDSKKGILKQIGEYLIKRGINVATETGQEVLQEGATIGATNIGSKIEKGEWAYNTDEIVDRLIDTGKQSALTFAALGVGGDTVSHVGNKVVNRNNSKDNTLSDSEYKVVSEVAEKEIAEQEANGKKLSTKEKNKIYDSVVEKMENGSLRIDTIEEILGGENYSTNKKSREENEALKKELFDLNEIKGNELTGNQRKRLAELEAMSLEETSKKIKADTTKLSEDVFNIVKGDRNGQGSMLLESYREVERRGQAFEADLTKYKGKQKDAVERAIKSGVLNNTNRSHEMVKTLSELEAKKGIVFDYADNKKLKEWGVALEGKTVNGLVNNGKVVLNVESHKAWEFVVGHEVGHVLKGTGDAYKKFQQELFKYAKSKGEYQNRYDTLAKLYNGVKGYETDFESKIKEELTSDLIGDYLFNDKNFVKHLTSDRNVFQKVWDEVKYLYNVATGKEKASIEKVMREFEKAWKELGKGTKEAVNDEGVKLSISETTDGRIAAVVESDILSKIDTTTWDKAKKETAKKAASDALKQFSGGIVVNGVTRKVNRQTRKEYTRSDYTEKLYRKSPEMFADKMRASDIADDIVVATTNWNRDGGLKHPRDDNFVDFDHGTTLIVSGNAKYSAEVVVGITQNGEAVFYDVVDMMPTTFEIKKAETSTTATTQDAIGDIQEISTNGSLAHMDGNVNTKFSISSESNYKSAIERGDTETAQRIVDEAAKNAGYDIKAYHGTGYDFTVFDKSKQGSNYEDWGRLGKGFYFAPTSREAETWAEHSRGDKNKVMPVYLRSENMLDSFEALPDDLKDTIPADWEGLTRRLAEKYAYNYIEYMQEFGYDVQKILTEKGYDGINGHTEFVVFDPEQVKSADAITYDDKGNVIPLAERFNKGNEDIRYSLSTDSEGNNLTPEQQEYFKDSKIRDKDGNLLVMYHGTTRGGFTVFDGGKDYWYFTNDKKYAYTFEGRKANGQFYPDVKERMEKGQATPQRYKVYLDVKNPYIADIDTVEDALYWDKSLAGLLREKGYDALMLEDMSQVIVLNANQIKNTDNKNPTSDADIRYSLSEDIKKADSEYMLAVENGDMETAQSLVNEAAEKSGYTTNSEYRGNHYAPYSQIDKESFTDLDKLQELCDEGSDLNLFAIANGISIQPDDYFGVNGARWYGYDDADGMEAYRAIKSAMNSIQRQMEQYGEVKEMPTIKVYRAVPKSVKETKLQSGGQWVTPSYLYARTHGEHSLNGKYKIIEETVSAENLWWDANDIREWGFDDGTNYAYRDTKNNRKLLDAVTYDDEGNVIPLSKRFNYRNADERYSISPESEAPSTVGTPLKDLYLAPMQEDIAPVAENVATNAEMPYNDYAPATAEEVEALSKESFEHITDEDAPPEVVQHGDYLPDSISIDIKSLKQLSKAISDVLPLTDRSQLKELENVIRDVSKGKIATKEDLYQEVKKRFDTYYYKERYDTIEKAKQMIKQVRLHVSDNIKADFGKGKDGYYDFMRKHFGKIRFSKEGMSVDRLYQNLSGFFPDLFSEEIWNDAEQLRRIAEITDTPATQFFPQSVDEGTLRYTTDFIYDSVQEYKDTVRLTDTLDMEGLPIDETLAPPVDDVAEDIAPTVEAETKDEPVTPKSTRLADGTRGEELLNESLDNYPMQTVEQKVAEKIRSVEGELADKRDLRRETENEYNEKIANLQKQYAEKKDKSTITAYNLLNSISRLEGLKARRDADYAKQISDLEARLERMKEPKYASAIQKQDKMQEHAKFAENLLGDTSIWKDKKLGVQYATNTEHRNLRDIVRDANGNADIARADAIYDALMGEYNRNHAKLNREDNEISKKYLDLKINRAESVYANMLGELRHNPDTTLTEKVVNEYYEKHKKKIDAKKVDKVIDFVMNDLDYFFENLNAALREQGMKEIPYRKGYFPHGTFPKQNFIQKLFNWKTQDTEIPTSIAGLTEDFKPVKSYQSFDKQRHTDETDYDIMRLFERYKDGALDWIYHIEDIQKRRAVENYIRYTHSDEGVQARIKEVYASEEYDADEAQAQIESILKEANNPLNNFVQDFMTHTNILANKKNSLDRAVEQGTNRNIYSVMTNVQNRMSANMVLANVRSALTNFIPITQSWAQVSPMRTLQATKDTIANAIKDDGLTNKSTFLTNRLKQADKLYQTNWDKVLDKAGIMFEIVDNFSSQVIWRSKYNQNLSKGMSEADAIANADQFAENVMAGRSKGNEPTLFNAKNPFVKAFTMFQLEVNNQYGYLFKDVPNDLKTETNHWKLNLAKGYTTAFIGAYVYNELLSRVTGSDAALDPIGIIEELLRDLGLFDDDEEEEPFDAVVNFGKNVAEELPFVGGLLGGGRIPISSAIPYSDKYSGGFVQAGEDAASAVGAFVDLFNHEEADWSGAKNLGRELMKPVLNVGLPVGGGQIKKTVQGLKMFSDEHPVKGSYTDSGNLRFPVEDTPLNRVQAGLFGQYASKNAREYFDNGYAPLKEKQIQEYQDVDLPIGDYWKYREGLSGLKNNEEKAEYINSLDIKDWQKNLLMNNILDRKEDVDMSNYDDFADWEEFDYAQKNPEKYEFFKANGISYSDYANADEDGKEAYNWAYNNPEGYALSKVVTPDVKQYKQYTKALYNIKADKDANGKSISGSRKEKVLNYINNLDADYETKIILFKSEYPSDDTYNYEIIEYINNRQNLTDDERVSIYEELGFKVKDGYVYWD